MAYNLKEKQFNVWIFLCEISLSSDILKEKDIKFDITWFLGITSDCDVQMVNAPN